MYRPENWNYHKKEYLESLAKQVCLVTSPNYGFEQPSIVYGVFEAGADAMLEALKATTARFDEQGLTFIIPKNVSLFSRGWLIFIPEEG